jgi:hypothetical protein
MPVYEEKDFRSYKVNDEGERFLIANFTARIVKETRIIDGRTSETFLTIEGWASNSVNPKQPIRLQPTEVTGTEFGGMGWVMNAWGVRAVISPGQGVREDLRMIIQINSNPERVDIYRQIGWVEIDKKMSYLHAGGAITTGGNDPTISVRLAQELSKFNLSSFDPKKTKEAFDASLAIVGVAPKRISWPVWCGMFSPIFGPVDFAIHITGRSGTFKSEFVSLIQSHYGSEMDARHLPGSWSSTPNALEAQAYYAANADFVVDDFVPTGTSWQIRAYQTGADKLIRGQGNQAGRARLTDTSGMQTTYFPRGMILSTGEDTPDGHSVRARMLIIEMTPGDIEPKNLSCAQKNRELFPTAMVDVIKTVAGGGWSVEKEAQKIRDKNIKIGHTRTPPMLGRLIATGQIVLIMAQKKGYLTAEKCNALIEEMTTAVIEMGNDQARHLEASDPIEVFFGSLRQALAGGQGHLRTRSGGIPLSCTNLGWTEERSHGAIATYKSHGPCIGWIDWEEDELLLEADTGFAVVKKVSGAEIAITKMTMWKRLKDAGMIVRCDETRQRNTIRITAEGHQRSVISLAASTALDTTEKPGKD